VTLLLVPVMAKRIWKFKDAFVVIDRSILFGYKPNFIDRASREVTDNTPVLSMART
jgi:hypothetical protein